MKLIAVDVGGTFTDIVCTDTETRHTIIHKSPTTPETTCWMGSSVSPRRDFGVVITADGTVDVGATARARATR